MTVAISPFSKTSEPRAMMTSRASSQFRARSRYSRPALTSPRSRCHARGPVEQTGLSIRLLCPQLETKHVPKEMMESKPLATSVQGNEEHRIPLELFEDELGARLVSEMGDQVRTHCVQHGDAKQELTAIVRLGLKHLLAEVVGDESVVPAELGDELVRILVEPERHPCQLQPGGPPFGSGDQRGHAVDSK